MNDGIELQDKDEILQEDDFVMTPQELFVPGRTTDGDQKKKATSRGILNTSRADDPELWDNDGDEKTEEEEDKEKKPFFSNTDYNIIMSVMNIVFCICLLITLNVGVEADLEMAIVSVITVVATMAVCGGLVWFLTCHWEPEHFQNAIIVHILEKQERDPEFARQMSRTYLVGEKRYVDDLNTYLKESVEQESKSDDIASKLIQDGVDVDQMMEKNDLDYDSDTRQGGDNFDDEMIIEDPEIHEFEPTKRSPPPGGKSGSKTDPKQHDSGVELTSMSSQEGKSETQKRNPDLTSGDAETPQGILKDNAERKRQKSVTWSVSGTEQLVGKERDDPNEWKESQESEEDLVVIDQKRFLNKDDSSADELMADHDRTKFYDQLFLSKLKPSFRKYRPGLQSLCPDPSALETMEESELESVIERKPMRRRVLKEAKALLAELREERKNHNDSEDEDFAAFLGGISDQESDDDIPGQ